MSFDHTFIYRSVYPEFGDLHVHADNNGSLQQLDRLVLTFSLQMPNDSLYENFTIIAEISYSDSGLNYVRSTDSCRVILEPTLEIYLSVSQRFVVPSVSISVTIPK